LIRICTSSTVASHKPLPMAASAQEAVLPGDPQVLLAKLEIGLVEG
jgi:hypothetical protein